MPAHGRRYDFPTSSSGRSLPRRRHRWHSQSAGTPNGERSALHGESGGLLRRYRQIPRYEPPPESPTAERATIRKAAQILGVYTSTIHPWLNDGFIAGEQVTPGAPGQIRITDELRARFVEQAPPGYLPMLEATMKLGSRAKPCCSV